jgi:hypothetical protein
MKGHFEGTALPNTYDLGWTAGDTPKPRVGLAFEVADTDGEVHRVTWYGNIGDKVVTSNGKSMSDITFESLRNAGWSNDDLAAPTGLGSVKSSLVLDEEEEEDKEGNPTGKTRTIVRWVNKPAGPNFKKPMSLAERAKFANDMKAKAIMHRQKSNGGASPNSSANGSGHPNAPGNGYGPGSDDIPY